MPFFLMKLSKTYKVWFWVALVAIVGVISFFDWMYQRDMNELKHFVTSYQRFDYAIQDFSAAKYSGELASLLVSKAQEAHVQLSEASMMRLSSLIKHEKEAMALAREIADIAGRETESLIAYGRALENADAGANEFLEESEALRQQRVDAYARFISLGKT